MAVSLDSVTEIGKTRYLRMWVDFPRLISARPASVLWEPTEQSIPPTTRTRREPIFYYLAEGQERWKTYRNGGDGCSRRTRGASVKGFKGFMAFPVTTLSLPTEPPHLRDSGQGKCICSSTIRTYPCSERLYLDEIGLVSQF